MRAEVAQGDVDEFDAMQSRDVVECEPCGFVGGSTDFVAQAAAGDVGAVDDADDVQRLRSAGESFFGWHDEGVDAEQPVEVGGVPGFFEDFATRGVVGTLAGVNAAAGEGPPAASVFVPVGEQHAVGVDDDAVRPDADVHPVTIAMGARRWWRGAGSCFVRARVRR